MPPRDRDDIQDIEHAVQDLISGGDSLPGDAEPDEVPADGATAVETTAAGSQPPRVAIVEGGKGKTLPPPRKTIVARLAKTDKVLDELERRARVWMTTEDFNKLWDYQGLKYALADLYSRYVRPDRPLEHFLADSKSFLQAFLVKGDVRLSPREQTKVRPHWWL